MTKISNVQIGLAIAIHNFKIRENWGQMMVEQPCMMPKAWKKILISFKKRRTREGTEIADFKIAAYCANQTDVHETILQGSSKIYWLYIISITKMTMQE